jgi:sirohydrochlorin ferrochelatase
VPRFPARDRGDVLKALLLAAHGSNYREANDDIQRVAEVVRHRGGFDLVEVCFLDLNEPAIAASIDHVVAHGATEVIVVPYFLHTGRHTIIDIPEILEEARRRHFAVAIILGDYLGHRRNALVQLLAERVTEKQ